MKPMLTYSDYLLCVLKTYLWDLCVTCECECEGETLLLT